MEKLLRVCHTLEFKRASLARWKALGSSVSLKQIAKEIGVAPKTLRTWRRLEESGQLDNGGTSRKLVTAEQQEIMQLKKDLQRSRMQCEILKKAAAYFAQDHVKGTP